jgi:hypothetical protein
MINPQTEWNIKEHIGVKFHIGSLLGFIGLYKLGSSNCNSTSPFKDNVDVANIFFGCYTTFYTSCTLFLFFFFIKFLLLVIK